jgi:hypothetical protein
MSRVITFYSYKGGTGRSMALANVAWILASNGKRVLAIDWDLEAPGLHRYFQPFLTDQELSGQESQGVIDMAIDFAVRAATPRESGQGGESAEKWYEPYADFSKWRQRLHWPSGDKLRLGKNGTGRIDFVPAGRQGPDYARRVNHFDWHGFYEKLGGGAFFDAAKARFAAYDYVLIDSRTGVSDTSGICTVHMPDTLVVCFTLNYQSIKGALAVALSVKEQRPKMRIFPVAMRIDASEEKLLNRMKSYAASVFTPLLAPSLDAKEYWYAMEVPYFARYAYAEKLALFEERGSITASTLPAMERLTAYLTDDEIRTAESLPDIERAHALAEFEGGEEAKTGRREIPNLSEERRTSRKTWSSSEDRWASSRWFLSYNPRDQGLAQQLKAAIEQEDSGFRLVLAPSQLRAGGAWLPQLAEEVAQATAFLLLVGSSGVGPWQVLEYDEALDRRVRDPHFPIVVVLVAGQTAPGLPFLRQAKWIVADDPTSKQSVGRLMEAVAGDSIRPSELWRYVVPYRGLEPMEEKDTDYFFGRARETTEALETLAKTPDSICLLIGNSGVGKTSVAHAGVLAALKRAAWPDAKGDYHKWPAAFRDSRYWLFLAFRPGAEPLKALVDSFLDTWQLDATDPERAGLLRKWIDLLGEGRVTISDLIDATGRRHAELALREPLTFFLLVDQAEELYVRAQEQQRRRFSELLAAGASDARMRILMTLRSDFFGELQADESLFAVHRPIHIPPLREHELVEVVSRPAALLSARFENSEAVHVLTRRTAEESSKDAGALPLLSYLLTDMWMGMIERGDGVLRLPAMSFDIGSILAERANAFLSGHPGSESDLWRLFTLRLAMITGDGEPVRRRAPRSEFTDQEWRLVSELADHPYRLLVTVTREGDETYTEVAHEAIFRRWDKFRDWIASEREFLAWRSQLESQRRFWEQAPASSKNDALLMGFALAQAQRWLATRSEDLSNVDRAFIDYSIRQSTSRRIRLRLLAGLVVTIGAIALWLLLTVLQRPGG